MALAGKMVVFKEQYTSIHRIQVTDGTLVKLLENAQNDEEKISTLTFTKIRQSVKLPITLLKQNQMKTKSLIE